MIEKTEGDILKIENEITKEKVILERKYQEECQQFSKNFEEKMDLQIHQKNLHLKKLREGNLQLSLQLKDERKAYEQKKISTKDIYNRKQQYEGSRNDNIAQTT